MEKFDSHNGLPWKTKKIQQTKQNKKQNVESATKGVRKRQPNNNKMLGGNEIFFVTLLYWCTAHIRSLSLSWCRTGNDIHVNRPNACLLFAFAQSRENRARFVYTLEYEPANE